MIYPVSALPNKMGIDIKFDSKMNYVSIPNKPSVDTVVFTGLSDKVFKFSPINYYCNQIFRRSIVASRQKFSPIASELAYRAKQVVITTADKQKLNCLDLNSKKSKRYVIFLHGMSQNVYNNQELYKSINNKGYGVFALEYRSFGKNAPAKVTEDLVGYDLDAAVLYLKSKKIKAKNIGVVGHSLGSVFAVDMGVRNPDIGFVALVSPVGNFANVGARYMTKKQPGCPDVIKKLIKKFPSVLNPLKKMFNMEDKIHKLNVPTYIIHSKDDRLIPLKDVRKMSVDTNRLVDYVELKHGGHRMDESKIEAIQNILPQ